MPPCVAFLISLKAPRRIGQSEAHGQIADEQLAIVQKRMFLIEFLRLRLVIVYQARVGLPL